MKLIQKLEVLEEKASNTQEKANSRMGDRQWDMGDNNKDFCQGRNKDRNSPWCRKSGSTPQMEPKQELNPPPLLKDMVFWITMTPKAFLQILELLCINTSLWQTNDIILLCKSHKN